MVTVPPGAYVTGDLQIGVHSGDHSRVEVDGGQLVLMQDSLHVGEESGGEGEFILHGGAMHCVMDVFVGGASQVPGAANKATLRIQGGSFLGRTITVGIGIGSEAVVSIEGSHPSAIHALDYVSIEGSSTLAFTLDERGVTPITIQSRVRGLSLAAHSHLEIALSAAPPNEDIRLVSGHVPIRGSFGGLPEGSEITAQFEGRTYQWRLTYHGGDGHDLVLKTAGAAAHLRPLPEPPVPLWLDHPLFPLTALTGTPAFEGAEGFGAFTRGGRGGKELYVDNLNDAGHGSLRAAVETAGARTVKFRVSGTIELKSAIDVRQPFLTIDGRDAPGDGITLHRHGMNVRTHDVVLRYFRIRIGDQDVNLDDKTVNYNGGDGEYALYFRLGSANAIADHLSLSWSTTKTLSTTKMADRITIQYCILSESLNFAGHGYASITGGNRVTWHHNLFAHHFNRNVRFQGMVDADFRNNVIYDWGEGSAYGEFDRLNYVGNYLKAGPSTTQKPLLFHRGDAVVAPGSLFVADNVMEGNESVNRDNWRGFGYYYFDRRLLEAPKPFPAPTVTVEPAQAAYEHVLKEAGATLPRRDRVDERIVREVRDGTGRIVKWVREIQ
ncbi:MAG TPA: hypothetical protein VEU96_17765 [Bryobacteraceae bacterium]|nr:hypothetical protein [Bryobacteraceae bacterium]